MTLSYVISLFFSWIPMVMSVIYNIRSGDILNRLWHIETYAYVPLALIFSLINQVFVIRSFIILHILAQLCFKQVVLDSENSHKWIIVSVNRLVHWKVRFQNLSTYGAIAGFEKVWRSNEISVSTKYRMLHPCVSSILLYASETWTIRKKRCENLSIWNVMLPTTPRIKLARKTKWHRDFPKKSNPEVGWCRQLSNVSLVCLDIYAARILAVSLTLPAPIPDKKQKLT